MRLSCRRGCRDKCASPACGPRFLTMRDEPAATKLLVVFAFFRTFVGFVHDIAPGAQRFRDAGKPCFFSGRKTVHMVTDFVEHIDDAVDTLERVGDFSRRRHCQALPLRKSAPAKPCSATPAVCATIRLQWHCRRSWRRR